MLTQIFSNWTKEEIQILLDNYKTKKSIEISKIIDRTPKAIQRRLYLLKLKRPIEFLSLIKLGERNPFYGKHLSKESIEKSRLSHQKKNPKLSETRKRLFKAGKLEMFPNGNPAKDPEIRKKMSINHSDISGSNNPMWGKIHTKETKKLIGLSSKERRKTLILPKKDTSIEIKIQQILKALHIEFFTHQYMHIEHGYQCDILVPQQETEGVIISQKTVIECDGDYWHGNSKKYAEENLTQRQREQRKRDLIRTKELTEKGYKVIRLWEHEIKKMKVEEFKEKLK